MRSNRKIDTPRPRPAATTPSRVAVVVAIAAVAMLAVAVLPSLADHGGPIHVEELTDRHEFTDDVSAQIRLKPEGRHRDVINLRDASNVAVLEITVEPGGRFPWHTHPGPVLAAITEGELVYVYADDCVERGYASGEAFVDPGGDNIHTAINPSEDEEAVVVATFLGAPDAGPLTIPVGDEERAMLDDRCLGS